MPYTKYETYNDSKCPACGNAKYIKLPKTFVSIRCDPSPDPECIVEPFPAICTVCGCMFIAKKYLHDFLSNNAFVNYDREDKKEIQSQNSVDEF